MLTASVDSGELHPGPRGRDYLTTSVTLDKCLDSSGAHLQNLFVKGSSRMAWKQRPSFPITITDLDEVASPSVR